MLISFVIFKQTELLNKPLSIKVFELDPTFGQLFKASYFLSKHIWIVCHNIDLIDKVVSDLRNFRVQYLNHGRVKAIGYVEEPTLNFVFDGLSFVTRQLGEGSKVHATVDFLLCILWQHLFVWLFSIMELFFHFC